MMKVNRKLLCGFALLREKKNKNNSNLTPVFLSHLQTEEDGK
jgi:hypothetical protein